MKKVVLENVKGVRRLEFELPRNCGVHLITGKNGTVKTNLLVALHRICNRDAFRNNFPIGAHNYDDVSRYRISYNNNGSIVSYSYTKHGWEPHPRNTNVLGSFGYADTIYVYYLENNGGNVTVLNKCKPSYILSGLTNSVDNNFDKLFLVEDKMAYFCLETMLKKHFHNTPQLLNYKIAFVGGWPQVIEFQKQMNNILPYKLGMVYAYLDYDAKTSLESLANTPNLNEGEQKTLNNYNDVRQYVEFLHITPEISMWDWLVNNEKVFLRQWQIKSKNILFLLNIFINSIDNLYHNERTSNSCKKCFNELLAQLVHDPDFPEAICRKMIVEIYYEQAIFNSPMWSGINQTLFAQLNG